MNGIHIQPRPLIIALIAAPVLAFAGYITWVVVPVVVREVVPAVVRAVRGM